MSFERNHNLIPTINLEEYELELHYSNKSDKILTVNFEDLEKMPRYNLVAYLSCAGNKRSYLQKEFPNIKGLKWTSGAISNANYTGVSLRYLLIEKMGLKEADLKGKHLIAVGYDADFQGTHYSASVPMEHVLD